MALRRQGLSQRRRAVGLTQEALAHRLGVERSTVVRWEAGDTEPLPSIRPNLARALNMSIDHLAELLHETKKAGTTLSFSADTEMTIPAPLPLGSAEPGRPVTAGADVGPAVSTVAHRPSPTAIPPDVESADVQQHRARSQRLTWFAAAGIVAFVLAEGAASVPFVTSRSGPTPPTIGAPAPAAAIPIPDIPTPGSASHGAHSAGSVPSAPVAVPDPPTDSAAVPAVAVAPARQTPRSDNRAASRPKPPSAKKAPAPPRHPAIPPDAYEAWSQAAALSENDQDKPRKRVRPEPPSRP